MPIPDAVFSHGPTIPASTQPTMGEMLNRIFEDAHDLEEHAAPAAPAPKPVIRAPGVAPVITAEEAVTIRKAFATGKVTAQQLADHHGLPFPTIVHILTGRIHPRAGGPIVPARPVIKPQSRRT